MDQFVPPPVAQNFGDLVAPAPDDTARLICRVGDQAVSQLGSGLGADNHRVTALEFAADLGDARG